MRQMTRGSHWCGAAFRKTRQTSVANWRRALHRTTTCAGRSYVRKGFSRSLKERASVRRHLFGSCNRLPVNYSSVNSIKPAGARCPWRKISRVLGRAPDCSILLNLASWRQIAPGDSNVGSAPSWLGGGSPLEQHRVGLLRGRHWTGKTCPAILPVNRLHQQMNQTK